MTTMESRATASAARPAHLLRVVLERMAWAGALLSPPFLRIALAIPFFRSGLTKWDGLSLSPGALYLFQEEFKLHLFGAELGFPLPGLTAFVTASAEIVLPILLVLGLATRFAAFGILAMTIVIQLVVPGGWLTYHLPWAAMALALIALGPGALSLDRLVARRIAA